MIVLEKTKVFIGIQGTGMQVTKKQKNVKTSVLGFWGFSEFNDSRSINANGITSQGNTVSE